MSAAAEIRARVRARSAFAGAQAKAATLGDDDDRDVVEDVIDRGQGRLAALAAALIAGTLSRDAFIERAGAALRGTYRAGAALGGAGRTAATRIADQLLASREQYLADFADELDASTDESGLSVARAAARAALWAGSAFSAFQMARGEQAQGDGATHAWFELDPDAQHCDDCEARAEGNPYPIDDMPGWPADGSTQCVGNDRCGVRFGTLDEGDSGE